MQEDYFSVLDIAYLRSTVPVTLTAGAVGAGFFRSSVGVASTSSTSSSSNADIPEGCKLDLPLWAVRSICDTGRPGGALAVAGIPKAVAGAKLADALRAAAEIVPLSERSPFFYRLSLDAVKLTGNPHAGVRDLLTTVWKDRFKAILKEVQASSDDVDESAFVQRLTAEERKLYAAGMSAEWMLSQWTQRRHLRLGSGDGVVGDGKPVFVSLLDE